MNADRYQQVKQIFLGACELESSKIPEFLDRTCGGDAELRTEVDSLLRHHFAETRMIDSTPPRNEIQPGQVVHPLPGLAAFIRNGEVSQTSERFPPGTVLAGRYRILAPLGRGGMGQVYRADDLKLDQPVALKFLLPERAQDRLWLDRYRTEVRLARRVSHPNVTRIYDIVETDGEVFISMEYVDGEDLASLLRRIGRPSAEKSLEIARQLCMGLGAVHAQGILHRDLKPANIMIDGRGIVRIVDFGIAAPVVQTESVQPLIGTPAYLAPELFRGAKPSVRSDLFSLGVVLYELVTGKEPLSGAPPIACDETVVVRPSSIVPEIDSALERVILECLERDPRRRPDTAYAIAARLPGDDLLALALAAGEMPSPSMVAAAGPVHALRPWVAIVCLATAVAALILVICLADRTFLLPQAGLTKPPAVLADKAESIITAMGAIPNGRERRDGFAINYAYLEQAIASDDGRRNWDLLRRGQPPAVYFWYRTADDPVALPALLGETLPPQPFTTDPGAIIVQLDGRGRLLQYFAASPGVGLSEATPKLVDWAVPCQLAGLRIEKLRPIHPFRKPPLYADSLVAWEGSPPENPQVPLRVEGASLAGRIVFFAVVPLWGQAQDATRAVQGPSPVRRDASPSRLALDLLAIIGGSSLAWYNLRRGRGDHRGAGKIVVIVLILGGLDWLFGEKHVAGFTEEVSLFLAGMARATLTAAVAWVSYFAVEPYIRRLRPQVMITWSRLLGGQLRDPLVGRDILIGGTCGVFLVLVVQLNVLLPSWFGFPPPLPKLPPVVHDLGAILGLRYKASILIASLITSLTLTLVVTLLMLMTRVVARQAWLATIVLWLVATGLQAASTDIDVSFPWLSSAIISAVAVTLLIRVGLVALLVGSFVWSVMLNSPLTANLAAWYSPASALAIALTAALLLCGFFAARAGRPILWQRLLERA